MPTPADGCGRIAGQAAEYTQRTANNEQRITLNTETNPIKTRLGLSPSPHAYWFYAAAIVLVPLYTNAFPLWRWVWRKLGSGPTAVLPFLAAFGVMIPIVRALVRRHSRRAWVWFGASLALAALALWLPDPAYPAKRIHVPEYMIVAFVLSRGLRERVDGWLAVVFCAVAVGLLGMHDELLQGLMPVRRYAVADVVVNALSGAAGAVAAYALGVIGPKTVDRRWPRGLVGLYVTMPLAVTWLALALMPYKKQVLPCVPVIAGYVLTLVISASACLVCSRRLAAGSRHGVRLTASIALALAIYPVLSYVCFWTFD